MTMQELETDILNDLKELGDTISQYSFLIACAGEVPPFPEEKKTEENLVRECQVNTWMYITIIDDKVSFEMDSEALIVKGALSLLQELYNGRTLEEVRSFTCTLPDHEDFSRHFNAEQLKGVRAILEKLAAL
ncbi:MAG: SufE family protein [Parasporobacterium sp.]|nr:SufE family protein [Parasporobacterium sp.]MBR3642640.1 SufE family protein [Parasporobacterium sp.]